MKKLFSVLAISLVIVLCLDMYDVQVSFAGNVAEGVLGLLVAVCVIACLIALGVILTVSLAGVLFGVALIACGAVIIAGIGAFWPVILLVAALIWMVKDKSHTA